MKLCHDERRYPRSREGLRRLFAVLLVLALVLTTAFTLAACNDDKGQGVSPEQERTEAVGLFERNVLAAFNEKWLPDMTDDEIAKLDAPGDHVEAQLWTDVIVGILYDSSLQTAKIRLAAEFVASEDGKRLLLDARVNADAVMELIAEVGFTSEDVSELGFAALRAVADRTDDVYTALVERLNKIKNKVESAGFNNIGEAVERAERIKESLKGEETITQTVAALDEAEEGIKLLFGFAYDFEQTVGTGSSGSGLASILQSISTGGSGALSGISDADAFVWLSGVVEGIARFGDEMTEEKAASVKRALASVRECFDGFAQPLEIVRDLTEWLGYAESAVGEIGLMTDYLTAMAAPLYDKDEKGEYTYDLVRKLKSLAAEKDNALSEVNMLLLLSEAAYSFMNEVSAAQLKAEFERIAAEGDRQKNMLLYFFVLMLAVDDGEQVEYSSDVTAMIVALLGEWSDVLFENAWREYVLAPDEVSESRLRRMSGSVLNMVELLNKALTENGEEPVEITVGADGDANGEYTEEWRAELARIADECMKRASSFAGAPLPSVAADVISEKLDEAYAGMGELAALGDMGYITDAASEDAEKVRELAENNAAVKMMVLILGVLFSH